MQRAAGPEAVVCKCGGFLHIESLILFSISILLFNHPKKVPSSVQSGLFPKKNQRNYRSTRAFQDKIRAQ
jgi:hypothetical protein